MRIEWEEGVPICLTGVSERENKENEAEIILLS